MEPIIISPKNEQEYSFIMELLGKLKIKTTTQREPRLRRMTMDEYNAMIDEGLADLQMQKIFDYYKEKAGLRSARKIIKNIYAHSSILAQNPKAGPCEELLKDKSEATRYLVEGNYKIVYYATEKTVYIVTVFDCRRNPSGMRGEVLK